MHPSDPRYQRREKIEILKTLNDAITHIEKAMEAEPNKKILSGDAKKSINNIKEQIEERRKANVKGTKFSESLLSVGNAIDNLNNNIIQEHGGKSSKPKIIQDVEKLLPKMREFTEIYASTNDNAYKNFKGETSNFKKEHLGIDPATPIKQNNSKEFNKISPPLAKFSKNLGEKLRKIKSDATAKTKKVLRKVGKSI